jgi:hypothetical protein
MSAKYDRLAQETTRLELLGNWASERRCRPHTQASERGWQPESRTRAWH